MRTDSNACTVLGLGWDRVQLAPGMAPRACSIRSNCFFELEPRYGIEP